MTTFAIRSTECELGPGAQVASRPIAMQEVLHDMGAAQVGTTIQPHEKRVAVELRGVTMRYRNVTAVAAVDLQIYEGEFFSLLGPSGCGKTTTLNIMGGFVEPDDGDVLIQGRSVRNVPAYRRPVNTVFQSYALFPHMSIAENVGFGPRMARQTRAEIDRRVREALALVSLAEMGWRYPNQLSGGQQQRVALARALVNHPAVLLLDEPLGALDLKLRRQMQLELSRIQREVGVTFVYVTHDQEEAMTMSDRVAVLNGGSVVQVGTPQEIYDNPASLFVADFIGSSNVLPGEVIEVEPPFVIVRLDVGAHIRIPIAKRLDGAERVSVVVRPDHMALATPGSGGADLNELSGTVAKVSFLGTHRQIAIRLGALEITLRQSVSTPDRAEPSPAVGESVGVRWPVSRSLCFAESAV